MDILRITVAKLHSNQAISAVHVRCWGRLAQLRTNRLAGALHGLPAQDGRWNELASIEVFVRHAPHCILLVPLAPEYTRAPQRAKTRQSTGGVGHTATAQDTSLVCFTTALASDTLLRSRSEKKTGHATATSGRVVAQATPACPKRPGFVKHNIVGCTLMLQLASRHIQSADLFSGCNRAYSDRSRGRASEPRISRRSWPRHRPYL